MNAARFARSLIDGGVDPQLARRRRAQRFDAFRAQITPRLDGHFRRLVTSLSVLFLAMLGNIPKDVLA